MQSKKYQVGVQPKDIDLSKGVELGKKVTEVVSQVVINLIGGGEILNHISGGAKSDRVVRALAPYVPLSNLIGLRFEINYGHDIMLVIFGDELSPQEVINRFQKFIDLADPVADLGYRINFKRVQFWVYPVVVYFDSKAYNQKAATILKEGWKRKIWANLYLRACTVNVPQKSVAYSNAPGLGGLIDSVATTFGSDLMRKFNVEDLYTVLNLTKQ